MISEKFIYWLNYVQASIFFVYWFICWFVYTLEYEQIVWTNKSSGWTNPLAFVLLWIYAVLSWTFLSRFHTRGRTTHQDGQIVWHLPHCEFMLYCRWLVHLDGQIIFPDGQISDNLFVEKFVRPIFTSGDLFVWDDLSVQTFCSSSSVKTTNVKL